MERDFKSEGLEPIRTLKPYEIFELLEGPRKETFAPAIRVRGKASKDGVTGWITAKDKKGVVFAEPDAKYYACVGTVAMTDALDIKKCKVVRKLVVGEMFTLLEGPNEDKDAGITRVRGKCCSDDAEGWITIKGNAGTTYAEASSKHYTVLQDVPLQKKYGSNSPDQALVRTLEKDEAIEALDKPKEEVFAAESRIKGRALADGAVGWITLKGDNMKNWSPYYKCKKAVPMHKGAVIEEEMVVRELAVGEVVEFIEGPRTEGKDVRIKARSEKDGAVGWVTIKDGEGKEFLA